MLHAEKGGEQFAVFIAMSGFPSGHERMETQERGIHWTPAKHEGCLLICLLLPNLNSCFTVAWLLRHDVASCFLVTGGISRRGTLGNISKSKSHAVFLQYSTGQARVLNTLKLWLGLVLFKLSVFRMGIQPEYFDPRMCHFRWIRPPVCGQINLPCMHYRWILSGFGHHFKLSFVNRGIKGAYHVNSASLV